MRHVEERRAGRLWGSRPRALAALAAVAGLGCGGAPVSLPASPASDRAIPQWQGRATLPPASLQAIETATRGGRPNEDFHHLADVIGPRLAGSAAVRRANEWMAQRLREHPFDSVWLEQFTVPSGWERGPVALTMLAPHRVLLRGETVAWSPPTAGSIPGEAIVWDGHLEGAPVLAGVRTPVVRSAWVLFPDGHREGNVAGFADDTLLGLLVAGRAAGIILAGPDAPEAMLRIGTPLRRPPLPHIVLPRESYARIVRLWNAGIPVRLEGTVGGVLTPGAVAGYNTVAEIVGSVRREEVVLVAVGLDSWDREPDAARDAAAVVATLEAARIVAVSRVRPARTIRFAFLGGEMQAALGAEEYLARHAPALRGHAAVVLVSAVDGRAPIDAVVRPDLEALWSSIGALGMNATAIPSTARTEGARTPLSGIGAAVFELRLTTSDEAPGGRSAAAHEMARRLAIAALALAELDGPPR